MRSISKRTAALFIAVLLFPLIGTACNHTNSNSGTSTSAGTSATSSAESSSATTTRGPDDDNHGCQWHALHRVGTHSREVPVSDRRCRRRTWALPFDNELKTKDGSGVYQQFDGGVLIYKNGSPVYFVWGKIRDAWNAVQASQGKLGLSDR